ncbi:MAG: phosphoglycerate kinase, partial [Candidatus Omnitrophica bacterium]|nr:phosphoglycerate kinase [Candidatus Omnitrophota bacterium]
ASSRIIAENNAAVEAADEASKEKKGKEAKARAEQIAKARQELRDNLRNKKLQTLEAYAPVRVLFAEGNDWQQQVSILRTDEGTPLGLAYYKNGRLTGTSILELPKADPELQRLQVIKAQYLHALRKMALAISREQGTAIEVTNIYKPEEKLSITWEVSADDPHSTVLKRVEQLVAGKWIALSEPENFVLKADELRGKSKAAYSGAGGEIGNLITASVMTRARNVRLVAIGGPTAEEIATFFTKGRLIHHGLLPFNRVSARQDVLTLFGKDIVVFSGRTGNAFRTASNYPWGEFEFAGAGIDMVEDATGAYTKDEELNQHREAGALRVIVSAPGKGKVLEKQFFVPNANLEDTYDPDKHFILSAASCTTGCAMIIAKLIKVTVAIKNKLLNVADFFKSPRKTALALVQHSFKKLEELNQKLRSLLATIHAYTSDEKKTPDTVASEKDATRSRDGDNNVPTTSTGAAGAKTKVDPMLISDGVAFRVPQPDGSIVEETYYLPGVYTVEDFKQAGEVLMRSVRGGILADIPNSGQILAIKNLKRMMSTINMIQVTHFETASGPWTQVDLTAWYANAGYFGDKEVDVQSFYARKENQPTVDLDEEGNIIVVQRKEVLPRLTMDDVDWQAKGAEGLNVLVRVDPNSPVVEVEDPVSKEKVRKLDLSKGIPPRIKKDAVSVKEASDRGAKVVIIGHQGRFGDPDFLSDLSETARIFAQEIGREVPFIDSWEKVPAALKAMKPGDVIMVPNARGLEVETAELPARVYAELPHIKALGDWADLVIMSGASVWHRQNGTVVGFPDKPNVTGRWWENELSVLSEVLGSVRQRPFIPIFAGGKSDDVIKLWDKGLADGRFDQVMTAGRT